jgi:hypothetical protein
MNTLGVTAPVSATDRVLLEGPHSRRRELWLVLRSVRDFIAGFRTLHFVGPCVTVFGSARYTSDHPYYALGRDGIRWTHLDSRCGTRHRSGCYGSMG